MPPGEDGQLFQITTHGAVAIPAALLTNAVTLGAGATATLRALGEARAELVIGRSRYALPLISDELPTAPPVPVPAEVTQHRTTAGVLIRALRRVSFAASREASRPNAAITRPMPHARPA